jgi:hypothetical protein
MAKLVASLIDVIVRGEHGQEGVTGDDEKVHAADVTGA